VAGAAAERVELAVFTAAELLASEPEEPDWLVPQLLARGWCMVVSAREKTGKGAFVAYLLGKLENGLPTCFGDACLEGPVTALVYTEEPRDSTREKLEASGLREASYTFGRELPTELRALEGVARYTLLWKVLAQEAHQRGHGILFVDNVSRAARIEEESGLELARAVESLIEEAAVFGLTVIVDHHHRKSGGDMRDRSRGGSATVGAVDVAVSMDRGKDASDRKRALMTVGRLSCTNWSKTIERSQDGREYIITEAVENEDDGTPGNRVQARRLQQLLDLTLEAKAATGEPWVPIEDIVDAWDRKSDTVKRYLKGLVEVHLVLYHDGPLGRRYAHAEHLTATEAGQTGDNVNYADL
jgi:hypothetical protein